MRAEEFEFLYRLEATYWWFVAMRRITDSLMGTELARENIRILDAGCGTGFNLNYDAASRSRRLFGLDIADPAIKCVKRRGIDKVAQASVTAIPFRSELFDVVFSFEVITHLPVDLHDDAFREMRRVLKSRGSLFIRVPAFMWLWSSHDEEIEAYYRYRLPELREKLIRLDFQIEWISYANGFLFPVILLNRFLKHLGIRKGSDVRPLPRGLAWVDGLFRRTLESEAKWFQSGRRLPFGLSLICIAKKVGRS
jgi:SAM-dependent methyltransferase